MTGPAGQLWLLESALRLTICRKWDSKSLVWCIDKQKGDAKGSLFYGCTVLNPPDSLHRVLKISSFAFKNKPVSATQAILGINLYPVDNTIGPPSIFIRWIALSNVLTTVVWLTNLRLKVHSFYHLLSPSVLRFTGALKLHGKEISETRIWPHTWKSNVRINGQMC